MTAQHLARDLMRPNSSFNNSLKRKRTTHQLLWRQQHTCGALVHWADHWWNAEWLENTTRPRALIHDIGTHPRGRTLQRAMYWILFNRFGTGVGRFRSCLHKQGIALMRLVSVAQKKRLLTMSSFAVQSISLSIECMAWQFWVRRQSIGCSTLALGSNAA